MAFQRKSGRWGLENLGLPKYGTRGISEYLFYALACFSNVNSIDNNKFDDLIGGRFRLLKSISGLDSCSPNEYVAYMNHQKLSWYPLERE